jgi:hypothetical protein
MNLDHAVGTIVSRGFTERQAQFLVLVARHSGVCVMRQYSAFAGIVFGHTTRKFFIKLERLGWVSTYDCARKRARIYHVRHRELYEAIGDPESRLRRPPTVPRALERIMLLDVILQEPDLVWLATPEEKMTHVSAFTAITKDSLPQMTIRRAATSPYGTSRTTHRSASIPKAAGSSSACSRRTPSASCARSSSVTSCCSPVSRRGRCVSPFPLTWRPTGGVSLRRQGMVSATS